MAAEMALNSWSEKYLGLVPVEMQMSINRIFENQIGNKI